MRYTQFSCAKLPSMNEFILRDFRAPYVSISLRDNEIDTWLELYSRESGEREYRYVIIDDLDATEFNDDQIENLVTVNWFYGLNESACASAIRILIG